MRNISTILLAFSAVLAACVPAPGDGNGDGAATGRIAQSAVSGGGDPCGADGACNFGVCGWDGDPDCPALDCSADGSCNPACSDDPDCPQTCDRGGVETIRLAVTPCGGMVLVRTGAGDPLVQARAHIESKWPNFRDAKDLDYDDDDDGNNESGETCWREGHAEANLDGFGVSLTRAYPGGGGGCSNLLWDDHHGGEDPQEPSLLFFEKNSGDKDTWNVIGAGYHYHYDACEVPCLEGAPESKFLIHEAGWHRVPGDGGFDCIQQKWVDTEGGVPVLDVDDQCVEIEPNDFHRFNLTFGENKHERVWTLHLFFEPGTSGVVLAPTDPWCRESDDASDPPVVGVDCPETDAFYPLTDDCGCN